MPTASVLRRSLLLAALLGAAVAMSLSVSTRMDDPDFWWHLRAGQWTVLHRAVPDLELFSANHVSERWVAYSWAYDVVIYAFHQAFGLAGQPVLSALSTLAIAGILFRMVRSLSGRTAFAAAATGAGLVAISAMLYGRSTMFTIVFALLEIHLLTEALVHGKRRGLVAVPFVLAAWANVHVQFVYGLFVLGCFLAQALHERRFSLARSLAWTGAASLAATCLTPYLGRIYLPFAQYLGQSGTIYRLLQELQSPGFRTLDGWAALGIVVAVAHGVGRRPVGKPFLLLLFAAAVAMGFTSVRDVWFVVATGLPLLALAHAREGEPEPRLENPWLVAAGTLAMAAGAAASQGVDEAALSARIAEHYPVRAAEHVEAHGYAGPLFNTYDWGGWLEWRWPDRLVSIDGRTYVHSTEYIARSFRIWNAMPGWREDRELGAAGIVLGASGLPLLAALEGDPRFRRVYRDEVATVFVRAGD